MKSSGFQHQIEGISDFMNIIMKATKWCGQLSSNETFFDDIWFSIVKNHRRLWLREYIIGGL